MFSKISDTLLSNLINTTISLVIVFVIYALVSLLFIRKIDNQKRKKRIRIRAFYIAVVVFLFLMARVWVDGFMHLVAVLGLVSAGLVVTNKETIMNLVGWLIITWRGVFSEDDLIQIQTYKGYVKSIGVLYFTLQEVSDADFSRLTGKEIKVPNGLTSNNSVINYSQTAKLILSDVSFKLTTENFDQKRDQLLLSVKKILSTYYQSNKHYSQPAIIKFDRSLKNKIDLEPSLSVVNKLEGEASVSCVIDFYCFVEDRSTLTSLVLMGIGEWQRSQSS